MGRQLVPALLVSALLAFAVSASSMALVLDRPRLWSAAVALIVLGGITPMIYAVNIRIVPVFSRRVWQRFALLRAGVILGAGGGWLVYLGRALPQQAVEVAGHGAALAGGLLFFASIMLLFRSPVTTSHAPPLPHPEQAGVDRIAINFTRMATIYLLLGLTVGLVVSMWTPERGRWDLVWAHLLLLGWFLSMASGVAYHVLSRWTGTRWRSPRLIRWHFIVVAVGLPFMVVALAADLRWLLAVAGSLQTVALLLFIWNVVPLANRLPAISRFSILAAASFLAVGVLLGASVAIDPANHVRLRFSHAQVNLLGWAGLLICGMGYYLFPRLAGHPLPWPRLARVQVALHVLGVLVGASAWWWYLAVDTGAGVFIRAGGLLVGLSFSIFAAIVAATFQRSGVAVTTTAVSLSPRRPPVVR